MKIHAKIVSYFESCDSPVDKEGFLYKKGEIKTSYHKRWFVLKGNLLFYKEKRTDRDVIGVIVLEGCTVQLCESDEQFAFSLVWGEPGLRTYKLAAEDQASQESWIKALLSANHSYLALLVKDMEKQYRDALSAFSGEPSRTSTLPNFSRAEAIYPGSAFGTRTSTLPAFPNAAVAAGPAPGPSLMPPPRSVSGKAASKKSPKLWPKKSANVVPVNAPALQAGEWSALCFDKEDFSKLHEDFGKDIKELIADWSKRGQAVGIVQEENLIDFG
ncbi:sesquipedalian-1-like [Salarias fasciatus]|uniref:Sesquipedalian n=1 Tax=Salarias fasciatus TaxID=181472 RepID=A0A672ITN9_SALFA|nr:sesquipedalian-1-like [Salarias fasciatus]